MFTLTFLFEGDLFFKNKAVSCSHMFPLWFTLFFVLSILETLFLVPYHVGYSLYFFLTSKYTVRPVFTSSTPTVCIGHRTTRRHKPDRTTISLLVEQCSFRAFLLLLLQGVAFEAPTKFSFFFGSVIFFSPCCSFRALLCTSLSSQAPFSI